VAGRAVSAAPRTRTAPRSPKARKKPLLAPDVTHVDYKDVALLRTFISDRGRIRARRLTGITPRQQRLVTQAVKNAREMALLPYAGR
jgi:small subunit ribosomal protein S18